ncbi:MAG: arsenate reductase (glutaredoxin) [Gammaproteobacteria bacterium]|jgi:arsenate reductase|nr:arsenate reductase (glutaredoxin) [Gammaproteobacteria bacterium]
MSAFTIYHNPRCSKSRQTLELLQENNISPEIILYHENTPSKEELKDVLGKLGMRARELLRIGEDAYKELGLQDESLSEEEIIDAMLASPKLIERPIVVAGNRAILGRPPENVLNLIKA